MEYLYGFLSLSLVTEEEAVCFPQIRDQNGQMLLLRMNEVIRATLGGEPLVVQLQRRSVCGIDCGGSRTLRSELRVVCGSSADRKMNVQTR